MPKISIIIPVYNVEPYLRHCLDSIINQTLKDIEIIIIADTESTDKSLEILQQYAKKYSFEIVSVAQFLYQNDTDHMFFLRSTSRAHTKDPRLVARKESTRQPATPLCKSRARPTASCPTGLQVLIAVQQRVPRSLLSEQHSSLRIGSLSKWIKDIKKI